MCCACTGHALCAVCGPRGTKSCTCSLAAARKDPKEIWDESEVVDVVEDDIDDGREVPE